MHFLNRTWNYTYILNDRKFCVGDGEALGGFLSNEEIREVSKWETQAKNQIGIVSYPNYLLLELLEKYAIAYFKIA